MPQTTGSLRSPQTAGGQTRYRPRDDRREARRPLLEHDRDPDHLPLEHEVQHTDRLLLLRSDLLGMAVANGARGVQRRQRLQIVPEPVLHLPDPYVRSG